MILIAGNSGIALLAELADLADQAAELVVLGNGLADGLVRDINPVLLVQRGENVVGALQDGQIHIVF